MVLFWVFSRLHLLLERLVYRSLMTLTYVCFFVALAHTFGWLERYIWWCLEKEASKALNDAKVTIGSFRLDWSQILQGKITLHASNVVLHTPLQNEWQWESPLIGRIGNASVECNAPITIFHFVFFRQELPIEIHSIQVWDVQVFVERRDNIFNVYLMDKALILPPPPGASSNNSNTRTHNRVNNSNNNALEPSTAITDSSVQNGTDDNSTKATKPTQQTDGTDNNDDQDDHARQQQHQQNKEQAKQLVNDMIHAVQSLGRAAQKGGLQGAIKQQGLELADKLRGMREAPNLEEGVKVIEQVGKVAVESMASTNILMPQRRDNVVVKPVYARCGRVILKDLRIFTKDSWIKSKPTSLEPREENDSKIDYKKGGNWNKPIFVESLVVRASEFCPPMSLKDEDGLPAIYQTVDKMVEVCWRRLVAETAKSNSGKLFQTAIGEVLSVMKTTTPVTPAVVPAASTNNSTIKKKTTGSTTQPKEVRV